MSRLLTTLVLQLAALSVYAQSAKPEAPTEQASPLTVLVFLVLFVGSCLAYAGYIWWRRDKDKSSEE